MLDALPVECLQQIIGYLPCASAITNIAAVNRELYAKISHDDYGILQYFVQKSFPSINVVSGSSWRETAIALTARSRAWSRRAIVARECYSPDFESMCLRNASAGTNASIRTSSGSGSGGGGRSGLKMGYVPVIDSYETNIKESGSKECLAWAAGGKIVVRSTTRETVVWQTSRFPSGDEPQKDILELHLLRPHQRGLHANSDRDESVIFRRANGEVGFVTTTKKGLPGDKNHRINGCEKPKYRRGEFVQGNEATDCMSMSSERQPVLALCNAQTIRLYNVNDDRVGPIEAIEKFRLEEEEAPATAVSTASRQRCARFLDMNNLAVAAQYLRGRESAPIKVYDLNANRATKMQKLQPTAVLLPSDLPKNSGRYWANKIAPLDAIGGNKDGRMFLSGWSDGVVRLHDTRTGRSSEMSYMDRVDEGQVLSLQPIGHEWFLAGSAHNGCLKMFDMRMPGAKVYSSLCMEAKQHSGRRMAMNPQPQPRLNDQYSHIRRDINIFLALKLPHRRAAGWKPLPLNDPPTGRYVGSVYSLSAPSAASSNIYAAIEDHVLQLSLSSSDDIKRGLVVDPLHGLERMDEPGVLDLSCYELPREGYESTDVVLLRTQRPLSGDNDIKSDANDDDEDGCEWDERWYSAAGSGRRGRQNEHEGERNYSWRGRGERRRRNEARA